MTKKSKTKKRETKISQTNLPRKFLLDKTWFVSHTKYTQWKINGSTSFVIDNIYYVNFRI